jgi:hypothetical protein
MFGASRQRACVILLFAVLVRVTASELRVFGLETEENQRRLRSEAVILLGGIGFQPVINTGKMTGWKPIPRFFHNLSAKAASTRKA